MRSSRWRLYCAAMLIGCMGAWSYADSLPTSNPLPALALWGTEYSGRFVEDNPGWGPHLLTLFPTGKNPDLAWHNLRQHLEWASQPQHSYVADGTGALVVYAHPRLKDFDEIISLKGLTGIEVLNRGELNERDQLWDRLLTQRLNQNEAPLWAFAGDDTHSSRKIGRSWFAARIERYHEAEVKKALREGNFYISNGPAIRSIGLEQRVISLELETPADVMWYRDGQYGTQPIGSSFDPGANRCIRIEKSVRKSQYTVPEEIDPRSGMRLHFVRAVVRKSSSEWAFTQPFCIAADGRIHSPYGETGTWYRGQTHNHSDAREGEVSEITRYYAAYRDAGIPLSFETGYDYWSMPLWRQPDDRVPEIYGVFPDRLVGPTMPAVVRIIGSNWSNKPEVFVGGNPVESSSMGSREGSSGEISDLFPQGISMTSSSSPIQVLEIQLPKDLPIGAFDITVKRADGLQDTALKSLINIQPSADLTGWTRFAGSSSRLNGPVGSRFAQAIVSDDKNNIWVGSHFGLSRFNGSSWETFHASSGSIHDDAIFDLARGLDGSLWYSTFDGVGRMGTDGKSQRWTSSEIGVEGGQVNQVLATLDATYITAMNRRQLFAYSQGSWTEIDVPTLLERRPILTALALAPDGTLWVGSDQGVLHRETGADGKVSWTAYEELNSSIPDNHVSRLAFEPNGRLWLATATTVAEITGGLGSFHQGTWQTFGPTNAPLPERRVWSVFVDQQANVWAGTGKGLACLRKNGTWKIYTTTNSGLSDDLVTDITQDRLGHLWFATANGVSRLDLSAVEGPK